MAYFQKEIDEKRAKELAAIENEKKGFLDLATTREHLLFLQRAISCSGKTSVFIHLGESSKCRQLESVKQCQSCRSRGRADESTEH